MRFVAIMPLVILSSAWVPMFAQERTFDLLQASVEDIQSAVGLGALSYERLAELYLRRIEAYDKNGPKLNSVRAINPKALETARALDRERKEKGLRSPLHGIPIAIKDNIDMAGMASSGGSQALANNHPARDATVIAKLRAAGAVLLIRTNMDELALGAQGLSSLGGQVLNPYDQKRNPGGSSGGSGVAINCAFATLGVGTETGYSVRSPATNNSLIGMVPTEGLISRAGVIPISFTQDRVGIHAKSAADAAILLQALRGFDAEDLLTTQSLGMANAEPYSSSLDERLTTVRLGVLRDLFRKGQKFESATAIVEKRIAFLKERGAGVVDGLSTGMDLLGLLPDMRLNNFELKVAFDAYLQRLGPASPFRSLAELVDSGKYLRQLDSRYKEALSTESLDHNPRYRARLENRRMLKGLLIQLMDRYRVDALIYPVKSLGAPALGVQDSNEYDNPTSSVTGLPAIVVPAGLNDEGFPLALEILGRPFAEAKLLQIAHAYERAGSQRAKPPRTPALAGDVFRYRP